MRWQTTIGLAMAATACLASAGARANTFGIEATEDLNYLAVTVTIAAVTNVLAIKITNDDPLPVHCKISIDMGPDTGRRRVTVDAGESRTVSYPVRRTMTQKVSIHTVCEGDVDAGDASSDE